MPSHSPVLTKPASNRFITLTLICALLLNFLPWQGLLPLRPDFAALLLLYWSIHQPRKIGMGTAWVFGLAMDVADGSLLGQHALAYAVAVFGALMLHRRILSFGPWRQAVHIAVLLLLLQALSLLARLASGANFPGWSHFLPTLTGALMWPGLIALLRAVQNRKRKPETAYPAAGTK